MLLAASAYAVALVLAGLWPFDFRSPCDDCPNAALPLESGGIALLAPGIVIDGAAGRRVSARLAATGTVTVAADVRSATLFQQGPARIVSISGGPAARNLTLGQQRDALVLRLRTSVTGPNGSKGVPAAPAIRPGERQVLAATFADSRISLFADGEPRGSGRLTGAQLTGWQTDFPLVIGNEATGDRPWLGTLYDAAIYDRALTPAEIAALAETGLRAEVPGLIYRLSDRCPASATRRPDDAGVTLGACALPARYANGHDWSLLKTGRRETSDYLGNALLWLPLGALLVGAATPSRRVGPLAVIALAGGLTLGIEIAQWPLFSRTSSLHDCVSAVIGAGLGIVLARLMPRFTR